MTKKRPATSRHAEPPAKRAKTLDFAFEDVATLANPAWTLERVFRRLQAAGKKASGEEPNPLDQTQRLAAYIQALLAQTSTTNSLCLCLTYREVCVSLLKGAHLRWFSQLIRRWRLQMPSQPALLRLVMTQPEDIVAFLSDLIRQELTDEDADDLLAEILLLLSQVLESLSDESLLAGPALLKLMRLVIRRSKGPSLECGLATLRNIVNQLLGSRVIQKMLHTDENDQQLMSLFSICREESSEDAFYAFAGEILSAIIARLQIVSATSPTAVVNATINLSRGVQLLLKFKKAESLRWQTITWESLLSQGLASTLRSVEEEKKGLASQAVSCLSEDELSKETCLSAIKCLWEVEPSRGEKLLRACHSFFLSRDHWEVSVSFWSAAILWAGSFHDSDVVWKTLPVARLEESIFASPPVLASWRLAGYKMLPGEVHRVSAVILEVFQSASDAPARSAACLLLMASNLLECVRLDSLDKKLLLEMASLTSHALEAELAPEFRDNFVLTLVPFLASQFARLNSSILTTASPIPIQTVHKSDDAPLQLVGRQAYSEEEGDLTSLRSIYSKLASDNSWAARTAMLCLQSLPAVSFPPAPTFVPSDISGATLLGFSETHWKLLANHGSPPDLPKAILKALLSSEDPVSSLKDVEAKTEQIGGLPGLRPFAAKRCEALLSSLHAGGMLPIDHVRKIGALFVECAEPDQVPICLSICLKLIESSDEEFKCDHSMLKLIAECFETGSHRALSDIEQDLTSLPSVLSQHLLFSVVTDNLPACVQPLRKCICALSSIKGVNPVEIYFEFATCLKSYLEDQDDVMDRWLSARVEAVERCLEDLAVAVLEEKSVLCLGKKDLARLQLLFPSIRDAGRAESSRLAAAVEKLRRIEAAEESSPFDLEEEVRKTAAAWLDSSSYDRVRSVSSPHKAQPSLQSVAKQINDVSRHIIEAQKSVASSLASREALLDVSTQLGICVLKTWALAAKSGVAYLRQTLPSLIAVADALALLGKALLLEIRQYYLRPNDSQMNSISRLCKMVYKITHAILTPPASELTEVRGAWHERVTCKHSDFVNLAVMAEALVYSMPATEERMRVDFARRLGQIVRALRATSNEFASKGKPFMPGLRAIIKAHKALKRIWQSEGTMSSDLRTYVEEAIEAPLQMAADLHHL